MVALKHRVLGSAALALFLGPLHGQNPISSTSVKLKNGKVFQVEVDKDGRPPIPKHEKFDTFLVIPRVITSAEIKTEKPLPWNASVVWWVKGKVLPEGKYRISISSPVEESLHASFMVDGGAVFNFQGFERNETPVAWDWMSEEGDSWMAFTVTVTDLASNESFELTRWMKFEMKIKDRLRDALRGALIRHRPATTK